jgi:hypothetical protein
MPSKCFDLCWQAAHGILQYPVTEGAASGTTAETQEVEKRRAQLPRLRARTVPSKNVTPPSAIPGGRLCIVRVCRII